MNILIKAILKLLTIALFANCNVVVGGELHIYPPVTTLTSAANYWTICALNIVVITSLMEKSVSANEFSVIQCFCGFLPVLVH